MPEVFVSIGSNVNREANVRQGLRLMAEHFGTLVASRVYESESVGFSGPNFYNLVVHFETEQPLAEVADVLHRVEDRCGRRRGGSSFDDRTLDLDVLLYGDLINHEPPWDIPRSDILNTRSCCARWRRSPLTGFTRRTDAATASCGRRSATPARSCGRWRPSRNVRPACRSGCRSGFSRE
jgi:2-amino-4-hydroxy-6-hydroxymethyldihydropteridine diphosphokinase